MRGWGGNGPHSWNYCRSTDLDDVPPIVQVARRFRLQDRSLRSAGQMRVTGPRRRQFCACWEHSITVKRGRQTDSSTEVETKRCGAAICKPSRSRGEVISRRMNEGATVQGADGRVSQGKASGSCVGDDEDAKEGARRQLECGASGWSGGEGRGQGGRGPSRRGIGSTVGG